MAHSRTITFDRPGNKIVDTIAPTLSDDLELEYPGLGLSLREKLIVTQKTSQFDSMQSYLPAGRYATILRKSIETDLQRLSKGFDEDRADKFRIFVQGMAWKTYLILVYCQLIDKIRDFFDCDCDDGYLPVEYDIRTGEITTRSTLQGYYCSLEEISVFSKSRWRAAELQEFCNNQWRFLAPTFDIPDFIRRIENADKASLIPQYRYHRVFQPQHVLPFDIVGRSKGTGFSKVWKIQVHPDHLNLYPPINDGIMALKEIANDVDEVRDDMATLMSQFELRALKATEVQSITKSASFLLAMVFRYNLVGLEYAFQRGPKTYMMFRWAELGNLYSFWRNTDLHERNKQAPFEKLYSTRKVLAWAKGQIGGLLGALCLLHSLNCRHGDLKPDNILVFGDQAIGRLKIADFGLTRIHTDATRNRGQETIMLTGAQRYEPPQVNKDHPGRVEAWSRRYDVWSMGCIFLEFVVWLCYGQTGLKKFDEALGDRRTQKFWRFKNGKPIHQKAVITKIGNLNATLKEPEWNGDETTDERKLRLYLLYVLNKVERRMLVIETDEKADGEDNSRATSESLFNAFTNDDMLGFDLKNRMKIAGEKAQ